jgi:hypothetical protein
VPFTVPSHLGRWQVETPASRTRPETRALGRDGALDRPADIHVAPREQEAIFSILRSLNSADEQLRGQGQAGQGHSNAYAARLLFAILDNYRRALATLGR